MLGLLENRYDDLRLVEINNRAVCGGVADIAQPVNEQIARLRIRAQNDLGSRFKVVNAGAGSDFAAFDWSLFE